jgi:putative transposase
MDVKRSYRYRVYPTAAQAESLAQTFGCTRFVYNCMLRLRTDRWLNEHKNIGYHETSALLTKLKKETDLAWLNDVSSVPVQQSLRHLQMAFANFFAGRSQYPVFKSKHGEQSAEFTTSGFKWNGLDLTLAKIAEPLSIRFSRQIPLSAKVTTVTVSKDAAGRYFVSMLCDETVSALPPVLAKVGIDLGLTHFAVLSTGEKVPALNAFRKKESKVIRQQRRLARKQKGSANQKKAKLKLARVHAHIADARKDFLHKLSTRLIHENQVIAIETLAVSNMQKNHRLAKSISDSGWAEFARQLEYKAKWYGRTLIGINRWYPSSKRCSGCGYTNNKMPLGVRMWDCQQCGSAHDRDINAARNILAAGLAVLVCGESVSPVSL